MDTQFPQFAATVRAGNGRDPGLQAAIAVVVLLAVMGYGCMRLEAVYTQRLARDFEGLGTASIGKDSEVADAMQSVWQDMQQEPADELVGGDGGRAVAGFPLPRTGRLAATEGDVLSIACCSAWNIDPLLGVIGVQN